MKLPAKGNVLARAARALGKSAARSSAKAVRHRKCFGTFCFQEDMRIGKMLAERILLERKSAEKAERNAAIKRAIARRLLLIAKKHRKR